MPYISDTILLTLQGENAVNEKRFAELGVVNAVAESTKAIDFLKPSDIEAMKTISSARSFQTPVITDQSVTVVTTPGFSFIPNNLPTSANQSYQVFDVFSGFRHYPSTYANNVIDEEFALKSVMSNVLYEMGKSIEGILLTQLEARKSQTLGFLTQASQGDGSYTFATNTLNLSKAAQKETMFFNIGAILNANEIGGDYRIVTSRAGLTIQKSEQLKYTNANEKDLSALGMFPLSNMHESGSISAGANVFNGFLIRDGSIGMIANFPYDFANGTTLANGKTWKVSNTELPYTRMRANIYINNEATDATSLVAGDSNSIMTTFQEMAIWHRFYVPFEYNSSLATRPSSIIKIAGLTA